ncbi:hypothetical protein [Xanthocytophaga agilis]|uniref:Uncharacterized protein n=1 Tax=Xanthocytophaga agilis TaxID=3048010 RepID=A0AAE3R7A9_9BACT|nr:hypothetical protein [Xanthocytophaga agilis]MDJ1502750.1 hypothetical protein [Xanthocytophaga agilis]
MKVRKKRFESSPPIYNQDGQSEYSKIRNIIKGSVDNKGRKKKDPNEDESLHTSTN